MLNVNLNILKFLESINNFCLSLAHIGLEVRSQYSVISHQLSVSAFFSPLPSKTAVNFERQLRTSARVGELRSGSRRGFFRAI
ncbi:MAG: hypothetical protein ACK5N2_03675 [bacterium]|uniref:hypothetical protein n=1 Tax=Microcystis aeruginosa TaxID=1126 RepID=UPI0011BED6F0|nr:hypothetical protein [Microcystis aeruginosa]